MLAARYRARFLQDSMKLSIIVIAYEMAREIPRTLQGLARDYQLGAQSLERVVD